jgi:hypothetical protein
MITLSEEELEDVCLSIVSASYLSLNYDNCDVKIQMFVNTTQFQIEVVARSTKS